MMSRRRLRHGIVGTEVGQGRPPAYMRPGRTRRSRPGRRGQGRRLILALLVLALLGLAAFWSIAG